MRIFPDRTDFSRYPSMLRMLLIGFLIVIMAAIVVILNFGTSSSVLELAVWHILDYQTENNSFASYAIRDAIYVRFPKVAPAIMDLTRQAESHPPEIAALDSLARLLGIVDAFYIDFEGGAGFSARNVVPIERITRRLGLGRGEEGRYEGRTIGPGFGKRRLKLDHSDYVLLIHYFNPRPRGLAQGVVGAVMDRREFIAGLPAFLDSLMNSTTYFALQTDTLDEYGRRQTIGLVDGSDTIWWRGDRSVVIKEPISTDDLTGERPAELGLVSPFSGLDVTLLIKTELPKYHKLTIKAIRLVPKMVIRIQIIFVLALLALMRNIWLARKATRRNQIALGHLAHSVKTPVARLQLAADILEGGQVSTPEEERKIIQTVSGECRQLRRAVENAALSLEGGKIAIHKEPGDLAELVRETAIAWQQSFDQVSIHLNIVGADKPLQTSFDRDKLRLALDNLIDNALRHTYLNLKNIAPGAAVVTISLRSEAKNMVISVSDSGAGIPQADMKNVFKRFSRSGKDPLTGVSGLGLGLALVKEIAEGHGGKARVEDAMRGAKLTLELPTKNS